jgi:uncharacterized membrane protein YkvA (DUF1232 family)
MAGNDEQNVRTNFWPKLQQNLARIPFADEVLAAWYCACCADDGVNLGQVPRYASPSRQGD